MSNRPLPTPHIGQTAATPAVFAAKLSYTIIDKRDRKKRRRRLQPNPKMEQFKPPYDVDFSQRDPVAEVDELFHTRWSPRSFKKTALPEHTLHVIFDAARWAPSCFNDQPWQFITSTNDTDFDLFCNLLNEKNQQWARNASLIGFITARKHFKHNGKPNNSAVFDCGAAWLAMTLQARRCGLYTHGMAGIKRDEVYPALDIDPETHHLICGFALGVLDKPQALAADFAAGEKPSARDPLDKIWRRGSRQ